MSQAYYYLERYEDAVALLERYRDSIHEDPVPLVMLAVAYAELGQRERAAATVEAVRRASPFFSPAGFVRAFVPRDQRAKMTASLAKAGLN